MFKRKAYEKLLNWKRECNGTYACLLEGARRVGKSTIAENFAKKYSKDVGEQYLISQKDAFNDHGIKFRPIYMLPFLLECKENEKIAMQGDSTFK